MARVTVKETTELALELGYTLKSKDGFYVLFNSDNYPVFTVKGVASMFSYLSDESLERTIAKIKPSSADEMEWVTDEQKYAEMDAFNAQVDKETEEKWNAYCEEVRQANELIESEGMSETYQKALSEVKAPTMTLGEAYEQCKENNPVLFAGMIKDYGNEEELYVEKMDELYTEQAHSVAVEKLDADLITYKADTSIYSDLSSGFYWDNVNNSLTDKPVSCDTCKHVDWEDGCNVSISHPKCREIYADIHAYEDLHGEVDFKVAQTCRGYEYHDHCDGEHELPRDPGKVEKCKKCNGDGYKPGRPITLVSGKYVALYERDVCDECDGTGERVISMDDYDPDTEEEI